MFDQTKFTKRDIRFINMAQKLAEDVEPWSGVRIVSVLAHRGEVLSYNPFQAHNIGKVLYSTGLHSDNDFPDMEEFVMV